jgi:rhodanese-related sulfurtransferase/protein-L-isoaspartate O-methyltransferase
MEHSKEFLELAENARKRVKEISVAETTEKIEKGAALIDVREDNEFADGHAKGATHLGRGIIERDIVGVFPDKTAELVLYCGGGYRSALAAENLEKMGYKNVFSMAGGWTAWKEANAPTDNISREQTLSDARERTKQLAAEFLEKGDSVGWFEALYKEAAGNNELIPWADLEPNKFLVRFAAQTDLQGNGRKALVVGCGLGDDARFLHDLGFNVTAFDISATAIEWARRLHADTDIKFVIADLFNTPKDWYMAFEFVLEVYTIQPLPLEMRPQTIDAIANFVALPGKLVVVTRGREDDEEPRELPWALSREDLSRFETNRLKQTHFEEMLGDEEGPIKRFVVEYER